VTAKDLSELSMLELFRVEVENQAPLLTAGLLALERDPEAADQLEACMRAAHSLKGAARIVDIASAVGVAHAMEDCFVAAQEGRLRLRQSHIDLLLGGVDLLARFAHSPEMEPLDSPQVKAFALALESAMQDDGKSDPAPDAAAPGSDEALLRAPAAMAGSAAPDRVVRVSADNLNRLLGLAGESLVAARWLRPFADSLLRLKRLQHEAVQRLDALDDHAAAPTASAQERTRIALDEVKRRVVECEQLLAEGLADVETFERRSADLSRRLYDEAVACRMRPFADGVHATPRMLRDLGRSLGKQVRLEIVGAATPVDRDVLERLDAPLGHLLRNAIDHGIESPEQRRAAG
jgi:two-component system sensor histidine kinase and response regulator WspE